MGDNSYQFSQIYSILSQYGVFGIAAFVIIVLVVQKLSLVGSFTAISDWLSSKRKKKDPILPIRPEPNDRTSGTLRDIETKIGTNNVILTKLNENIISCKTENGKWFQKTDKLTKILTENIEEMHRLEELLIKVLDKL